MATAEFFTKRIEGKKAEIAKLEKKLARIEKAEKSNWEDNPYGYYINDKKWALRDLEDAKKALADYEAKLEAENNKASSRNVQVIIDFLNNWKEESKAYYEKMLPKYVEALEEYYRIDREYTHWYNHAHGDDWKSELKSRRAVRDNAKKSFKANWSWIEPYIERDIWTDSYTLNMSKLSKDLDNEADRKYDFIIDRTNEIVTKITDASNLYIGNSGELNGFIVGTTGVAKVNTIGAGGYNIQRFHFRTLINRVK